MSTFIESENDTRVTKPLVRWIETHEIMKGRINSHGEQSWPQVYETDLGHTIKVIEYSAFQEAQTKLAELEAYKRNGILDFAQINNELREQLESARKEILKWKNQK